VIEMSAKLPKGRGTWSAFWLLSANRPLNWPSDGEIDIMEAVGYEVNPSKVYGSIHCHDFFGGNSKTQNTPINDPYNSFHTYKVDWNSKRGGQQGVDDSIFPTQYVIDYVRVYAPNN